MAGLYQNNARFDTKIHSYPHCSPLIPLDSNRVWETNLGRYCNCDRVSIAAHVGVLIIVCLDHDSDGNGLRCIFRDRTGLLRKIKGVWKILAGDAGILHPVVVRAISVKTEVL